MVLKLVLSFIVGNFIVKFAKTNINTKGNFSWKPFSNSTSNKIISHYLTNRPNKKVGCCYFSFNLLKPYPKLKSNTTRFCMTKVNVGADVAMEDVSQGDISDLIEVMESAARANDLNDAQLNLKSDLI